MAGKVRALNTVEDAFAELIADAFGAFVERLAGGPAGFSISGPTLEVSGMTGTYKAPKS